MSLPGIDQDTARALADAAHGICPYSKAVHGNIDIETTLAGAADAVQTAA